MLSPSPVPPKVRVEELSACWGWNLADGGKAVYAVLAKQASA